MSLPDNFLWGGAVAAHQLEGGWKEGGRGAECQRCADSRSPWRAKTDYGWRDFGGALSEP